MSKRSLSVILLTSCLVLSCGKKDERIDLTRYVWVDPGPSVVDLSQKRAAMRVVVRNVSEIELRALRLEVKSEACAATVKPKKGIAKLAPADRTAFTVELSRHANKRPDRYPLLLTLYAEGLPVAAGLDLMVDLRGAAERGWIDVGQVKLIHRPDSRTTYYLLAGLPLLILVGWLLFRLGRRRKEKAEAKKD